MSYSLCCVVEWHIVNFKSFCDTENEGFYSEKFVIDSLHNSSWFLKCYPKGTGGPDVFALFLCRCREDHGPEKIHVKFNISLLDDKGTSIFKDEPKMCYFKIKEEIGSLLFIEQAKISHQAENYFPQDVCRIRCQILKLKSVDQVIKYFLKTHLPITKYIFDYTPLSDSPKTFRIVSAVDEKTIFTFTIRCINERSLKILFSGDSDNVRKFSWQCKMYNRLTKETYLHVRQDLPALAFNIIHNSLIRLDLSYPESTCELSIILHEEMHNPATYLPPKLQSISCDKTNENDIKSIPKSKTLPRSSLKNDIVRMYNEGIMSDFSAKVKDREFPVHSNILASRSPVFRTMLETNMKEKRDKVLKLDDMDENVVCRFLDYLYTDDTGELTVDLALELYRLGHLYEIVGLKEDSASFLKQNINISNIGDIILLSDRHEDEGLMSVAVQFIYCHEKEVLLCKEFKDFAKSNAQLSVDIFFKLSEMKLK